jgi:hypothetical protein
MTISQTQTHSAMNTLNTNPKQPNFMAISDGTAPGFADAQIGKKKKASNLMPTIRFELNLEPPTSDKHSEFNYNKLVVKTLKLVKKKSKQSKLSNFNFELASGQTLTPRKNLSFGFMY